MHSIFSLFIIWSTYGNLSISKIDKIHFSQKHTKHQNRGAKSLPIIAYNSTILKIQPNGKKITSIKNSPKPTPLSFNGINQTNRKSSITFN